MIQKTAGAVLPQNPPYMVDRFAPTRRKTIPVIVGNRVIGGDAPVLVQSMTTTLTKDVDATVFQTLELWRAGCELVRITAPTQKDAEVLRDIVQKVRAAGCDVPISADIHFQPRAAAEAVKWVEKVRVNPGNFVDSKAATPREYDDASFESGRQRVYESFAPLVRAAKARGVALRIGTNHGSLSDRMMWRFGDSVEGMVESALEYLEVCEDEGFDQVVFSMKSSNPRVAIQAYRLLAMRLDRGGHNS
jgi:(E)-4-hydroxy-3-methylbut-2-enyl-diphosphate synthase